MDSSLSTQVQARSFRLADSIVKPQLNLIQRGHEFIQVERQVMLVLLFLSERVDQVVTREEILSALWSDSFSNDEVLTQVISKLRRSLGDSPQKNQGIQTIRKVGYRLRGPVAYRDETSTAVAEALDHPPKKLSRKTKRSWSWVAIALIGVVTGINAVSLLARDSTPDPRVMRIRKFISDTDSSAVDLMSMADQNLKWTPEAQMVEIPVRELDASDIEDLLKLMSKGEIKESP